MFMTMPSMPPLPSLSIVSRHQPGAIDAWKDDDDWVHLEIEDKRLGRGPAPLSRVLGAQAALSAAWEWDAHAVQYTVVGAPSPRANREALGPLSAVGAHVEMRWLMVDIDTDPHRPWSELGADGEALYLRLCAALDALDPTGPLPPPIRWRTRAGMRAAWPLAAPLVVEERDPRAWTRAYIATLDALERLTGGVVRPDRAAKDWTRLFRLPGALRGSSSAPREDGDLCIPRDLLPLQLAIPPSPPDAAESRRRGRVVTEQLGHDQEDHRSCATDDDPCDSIHIRPEDGDHSALDRAAARIARATEGTRSDTANAVAYYVGRRLASWGVEESEAWRQLCDAARQAGLTEAEATGAVSRGLDAGRREPVACRDDESSYHYMSTKVMMSCPDYGDVDNGGPSTIAGIGTSASAISRLNGSKRIARLDLESIADRIFPAPECSNPYRQLVASVRQPGLMARVARGCGKWSCLGCASDLRALWYVGARIGVVSCDRCYRSEIDDDSATRQAVKKRLQRAGASYLIARTAPGRLSLLTSASARVEGEVELPTDADSREQALAQILRWTARDGREHGHLIASSRDWRCAEIEQSKDWRHVGRTERLMDDEEARRRIEAEAAARGVAARVERQKRALLISLSCDQQMRIEILARAIGLKVSDRYARDTGVERPAERVGDGVEVGCGATNEDVWVE